jgi:YD repeat-containing protein
MVKIFLTIAFLCTALCTHAQRTAGNKADEGIYGMVKCITYIDSVVANLSDYHSISCGDDLYYLQPDSNYSTNTVDERGNQLSRNYYDKDSNLQKRFAHEFDSYNNRIQTKMWNENNNLIGTYVYKYDSTRIPIERTTYDSTNKIVQVMDLHMKHILTHYLECYDKNGKQTSIVDYIDTGRYKYDFGLSDHYFNDRKSLKPVIDTLIDSVFTLDNKGLKNLTVTFKSAGQKWYTKYSYDKAGNEIEITDIDPDGERQSVIKKKYDMRGNLLAYAERWEVNYGVSGYKGEYRYDLKGSKIEAKYYEFGSMLTNDSADDDGLGIFFQIFSDTVYDSKGRIIQYQQYAGGIVYKRVVYAYDIYGNVVHMVEYDKNNTLKTERFVRYEDYDARGNWQKAIAWGLNGDYTDYIPRVSYRKIEYYD